MNMRVRMAAAAGVGLTIAVACGGDDFESTSGVGGGGASSGAAGSGASGAGGSAGSGGSAAGQGGAAGPGGSAGQGGAPGLGGSAGQGGAPGAGGSAGQGGSTPGCLPTEKVCKGICVAIDDPQFGCGNDCNPCAPPDEGTAICSEGACVAACGMGERPCGYGCVAMGSLKVECNGQCVDCSTDACALRACEPVVAAKQKAPTGITSAGNRYYWVNDALKSDGGGAYWHAKSGTGSGGVELTTPADIAASGILMGVALPNEDAVGLYDVPAGSGTSIGGSTVSSPIAVARYGTTFYWINSGSAGSIASRDAVGTVITVHRAGLSNPTSLTVTGTTVFYTAAGASTSGSGSVHRFATTNMDVQDLALGQDDPYSIVNDANRVFWVERAGGKVWRALRDGSASAEPLVTGLTDVKAVDVHGDFAYFVAGDTVYRALKTPGTVPVAPEVVYQHPNPTGEASIHIDSERVYWTFKTPGVVMWLPKPPAQ